MHIRYYSSPRWPCRFQKLARCKARPRRSVGVVSCLQADIRRVCRRPRELLGIATPRRALGGRRANRSPRIRWYLCTEGECALQRQLRAAVLLQEKRWIGCRYPFPLMYLPTVDIQVPHQKPTKRNQIPSFLFSARAMKQVQRPVFREAAKSGFNQSPPQHELSLSLETRRPCVLLQVLRPSICFCFCGSTGTSLGNRFDSFCSWKHVNVTTMLTSEMFNSAGTSSSL